MIMFKVKEFFYLAPFNKEVLLEVPIVAEREIYYARVLLLKSYKNEV